MRTRSSVIIFNDKNVLLLHRWKNGKEYFVIPGGGVKEGETFREAAKREIKEETSLDVDLEKGQEDLAFDDHKEVFYCSKKFYGEPRLGGPEAKRNSPKNKYVIEWVSVPDINGVNILPKIKKIIKDFFIKYGKN